MLYSIEAEKSVCGCILWDKESFFRISTHVSDEDLFFAETKQVFSAVNSVFSKNLEINWITVFNEISKNPNNTVSEEYLKELVQVYAVDVDSAVSFAMQIREMSGKRILKLGIEKLAGSVESDDLTQSVSKFHEVMAKVFSKDSEEEINLGQEFVDMLDMGHSDCLLTGIPQIDREISNFGPGEIVILAARPATGKSALMLQSASANMEIGKKVGIISLEMLPKRLLLRLIARRTGISTRTISAMSSQEFFSKPQLVSALEKYTTGENFFIESPKMQSIDSIIRTMNRMYHNQGVEIFYIDYMQLIGLDSSANSNRNNELATASRMLKNLATNLEVPIYILSQLNRAVESRMFARPMQADLRDSGGIEQDASIIAFLWNDFSDKMGMDEAQIMKEAKTKPEQDVFFDIQKHRDGEESIHKLLFRKAIMDFSPLDAAKNDKKRILE